MARYPPSLVRAGLGLALCTAIVCSGGVARATVNPVGATIKQTMTAGPYRLVLMIGPLEQMCTRAVSTHKRWVKRR